MDQYHLQVVCENAHCTVDSGHFCNVGTHVVWLHQTSTLRPCQFDRLIHEKSSEKKLVGRSKYIHNYESRYKFQKLNTTQRHYVRICLVRAQCGHFLKSHH